MAAATTYTATDISELKSILTNLTALVGHLIDQQAHQSLTYTSNTRSARDAADADFTVKQADRIYETIGDNLDETNDSLSSLTDRVDTLRDDLASLTLSVSSSTPKYYAESTSTPSTAPQVTGSRSVAIGDGSYVSGSGSIALGDHVSVTGNLSVAVGAYAAATTWNTFAFGYGAFASGVFSQAIGSVNNVSGYAASAFGFQNTVSGAGASAFGSSLTNSIGTSTMIGPSNAAKLTILGAAGSVGFVGIGTTTPSAKLHVTGTAGNSDIFALSSSTNTRLLTVTSAGKVGIGTSTPSETLTVKGSIMGTGHMALGNRSVGVDTFSFPNEDGYHNPSFPGLPYGDGLTAGLLVQEESTTAPDGEYPIATGITSILAANPSSASEAAFLYSSIYGAAVMPQDAVPGLNNVSAIFSNERFTTATSASLAGVYSAVDNWGSGNLDSMDGFNSGILNDSGAGTTTNVAGFNSYIFGHKIVNAYGTKTRIQQGGGGTITNAYGLYIDTIQGTNNWGLYQSNASNKNYFAGSLGIGTSTPSAQLTTTGTVRFAGFGAGTLQTDALGNVTVSSDERLKDIHDHFTRGIADLIKIDPITYTWKEETGYDTATVYTGFSAQNVQDAIPEAVATDTKGFLTLSDRPILAAVVNAVKELWEKVTGHDIEIEELQQQLREQQSEIRALQEALDIELEPEEQESAGEELPPEGEEEPPIEPVVEPQPPEVQDAPDTEQNESVTEEPTEETSV